jgi:hypothetical protein
MALDGKGTLYRNGAQLSDVIYCVEQIDTRVVGVLMIHDDTSLKWQGISEGLMLHLVSHRFLLYLAVAYLEAHYYKIITASTFVSLQ